MAAGNTYTPLATQTLGSAAASVTFSSISGAYTDLVLVINAYETAAQNINLQFNGDTTTTNYSGTTLIGNGTSATSARSTNIIYFDRQGNSAGFGTGIAHIMNYSNATTYKTVLLRYGYPTTTTEATVGLWRGTIAAITSIKIIAESTTLVSGSTFTLYGILAA